MAKDAGTTQVAESPTPSEQTAEFNADAIAETPEIQEAFAKAFPEEHPEGATPTRRQQSPEETAEELAGLPGATEADDGIDADGDDKKPEEPAKEPDAGDAKEQDGGEEPPTLNPLHVQAAKRMGWSDDQIQEFAKANPEMASQTFQRLLESVNNLSAQFGAMGGQPVAPAMPAAQPLQQPGQPAQQQAPPNLLEQLYPNLPDLQTKYGPDFVADIVQPLAAQVGEMRTFYQAQKDAAVVTEMGAFFSSLPEAFHDLYGKADNFNQQQYQTRLELGALGDRIRAGALRQGQAVSVHDALEQANMMYAAEHVAKLERERLTSQVKKRSATITSQPSQRARSAASPGPKTEQGAMDAYASKAAEHGISLVSDD